MIPTPDDVRLLEGFRAGSRTDFATLVERNAREIYPFLARISGPADAERLTQETFAALYAAPEGFQSSKCPFRVWLLGLAVRAAAAHAGFDGRWETATRASFPEPRRDVIARNPDADPGRVVSLVIGELPFAQRVALVLKAYKDFSVPEISATLNCSGDVVAALLIAAYESFVHRLAGRSHA